MDRDSVGRLYGARPVSVDLARGRRLAQLRHRTAPTRRRRHQTAATTRPGQRLPLTPPVVADRLAAGALAPRPPDRRCSLLGGVGRTTVTGLLTSILAELPVRAHLAADRRRRTRTANPRLDCPTAGRSRSNTRRHEPTSRPARRRASGPSRQVSASTSAKTSPPSSWMPLQVCRPNCPGSPATPPPRSCSLTRPDRASLAETAEALVWLHDHADIPKSRVVALINHGTGHVDRGSRAAAVSLCGPIRGRPPPPVPSSPRTRASRCRAAHSLPAPSSDARSPTPRSTSRQSAASTPITTAAADPNHHPHRRVPMTPQVRDPGHSADRSPSRSRRR